MGTGGFVVVVVVVVAVVGAECRPAAATDGRLAVVAVKAMDWGFGVGRERHGGRCWLVLARRRISRYLGVSTTC